MPNEEMPQILIAGEPPQETAVVQPPATPQAEPFDLRQEEWQEVSSSITPTRITEIGLQRRLIVQRTDRTGNQFVIRMGPTYYGTFKQAGIFTLKEAYETITFSPAITFIFLRDEPAVPGCKLENYFNADFIELMSAAPNNNVIRAHMMRILKLQPAAELDTFEKLKEWVEKTFPKRGPSLKYKPNPRYTSANAGLADFPPPFETATLDRNPRPNEPMMDMEVRYHSREFGRCAYSTNRSCRYSAEFGITQIKEIVENEETTELSEIIRHLAIIKFRHLDGNGELDTDTDGESTSHHEANNTEDESFEVQERAHRIQQLAAFIRLNDPELAETLGL